MPNRNQAAGLEHAWTREATRVHLRYLLEVVEACGLCPWAEPSRREGRVRVRVLLQTDDVDLEASVEAMGELARDTQAEVAFLIYPRLNLGRAAFDDFAGRARAADGERYDLGRVPFVSAVFHPDAEPHLGDPERLIPFLRRTPDPTVQLLRVSALDAVRSLTSQGTQFVNIEDFDPHAVTPSTPLRERIARTNLATVLRMGPGEMRRILDDIRRDRDETYENLAGPEPLTRPSAAPPRTPASRSPG